MERRPKGDSGKLFRFTHTRGGADTVRPALAFTCSYVGYPPNVDTNTLYHSRFS